MKQKFRVSGRDGILSMIPVTLGFHPVDSVVLVTLAPGGRRVGPIARVDLVHYWQDADRLAEQLTSALTRHGDRCVLVFYGLEVDPLGFGDLLADYHLSVEQVYFTDNTPHGLHPALHAEAVAAGKVVADDRDAVRARVEFFAAAEPDDDQALLFAMADAASRDGYLAENISAAADVLPHILATCRRLTDPAPGASPGCVRVVANLCAVAGILAYRIGDGALSQVCLDRARRIDPSHQLTALMTTTMELGFAPADLDGLMEGL